MGILPVLVLLAGKMPAPQEILGYFFNWKSLNLTIRVIAGINEIIEVRSEHEIISTLGLDIGFG